MSKKETPQTNVQPARDNDVYTSGGRTIFENTGVKPVETMINILDDIDSVSDNLTSVVAKKIQANYTNKELTLVLLKVLEMYKSGVPFPMLVGALDHKRN